MMKKIIEYKLITLGIISLVLILVIGLFAIPWTDDYVSFLKSRDYSLFEVLKHSYLYWDGRMMSIGGITRILWLKYFNYTSLIIVWASSSIISALLILKIINLQFNIHYKNKISFIITTLIVVTAYFLSQKNIASQVIYWITGGIYMFNNMIALFWIYLLVINNGKRRSALFQIVFFLLGIFVTFGSHNLGIGLMLYCTILLIENRILKNNNSFIVLALISVSVGTIILFSCPGTINRLNSVENNHISFNVLELILNYCNILLSYIQSNRYIFISSSIALLISFSNYLSFENLKPDIKDHQTLFWLKRFKWLLVALATILPFVFAPSLAVPRTGIYFLTFFFFFLFDNTLFFINKYLKAFQNKVFSNISILLILSLFVVNIYQIAKQLPKAYLLKQSFLFREQKIIQLKSQNKKIEIYEIKQSEAPFLLKFWDLDEDEKYWANQNCAKYYNVTSIKIVKSNKN